MPPDGLYAGGGGADLTEVDGPVGGELGAGGARRDDVLMGRNEEEGGRGCKLERTGVAWKGFVCNTHVITPSVIRIRQPTDMKSGW